MFAQPSNTMDGDLFTKFLATGNSNKGDSSFA